MKARAQADAVIRALWRVALACTLVFAFTGVPTFPRYAAADDGNPEDGTGYAYPELDDVDLTWFDPATYSVRTTYEIKTGAQLAGLAYLTYGHAQDAYPSSWKKSQCKAYNFSGKTIELTSNVDLKSVCGAAAGVSWRPIGSGYGEINGNVYFRGTFDGKGHTVENLYINNTQYYSALFGAVAGGEVKNLTVTGTVNSGSCCAGIVATCSSTNLSNLVNKADVTANSTFDDQGYTSSAAGVVCYSMNTGSKNVVFDRLENDGDVRGYSYYTGGVVGFAGTAASGGGSLKVSRSANNGNVSVGRAANASDDNCAVGGVIGATTGRQQGGAVMVEGCYNAGAVSSSNLQTTGGLVGYLGGNGSYVKSSYSTGDVSGKETAGGVVGTLDAKGSGNGIFNSYNAGTINGEGASAGVVAKVTGTGSAFKNNYSTGQTAYGNGTGLGSKEKKAALTDMDGLKSDEVRDVLNDGLDDVDNNDFAFGIRTGKNANRFILCWDGGFDQGEPESKDDEGESDDSADDPAVPDDGNTDDTGSGSKKGSGADGAAAAGSAKDSGDGNGKSSNDQAGSKTGGTAVTANDIDTSKLQPMATTSNSDVSQHAQQQESGGSAADAQGATTRMYEITQKPETQDDMSGFLGSEQVNPLFVILAAVVLLAGLVYENVSFSRSRGSFGFRAGRMNG